MLTCHIPLNSLGLQNMTHFSMLKANARDVLVVQWFRPCAPNAGGLGMILGQGTRSHVLQLQISHAAMKNEDPTCHN